MSKYAKLITFIVGGAAMILNDYFGIGVLVGMEDQISQAIIMLLTAVGVFAADDSAKFKS